MIGDDQLIQRVAALDDRHAYATLVKRYQSPLRAFLRRLTKSDHALADDIAQDAFIRAYQKITSFAQEGSFYSWLLKIAVNRFYDTQRKKSAHLLEFSDNLDEHEHHTTCMSTHEMQMDIAKALAILSLPECTAIVLNYQEGLSHSEIATILDCPIGSVKTLIARAKSKLKLYLHH